MKKIGLFLDATPHHGGTFQYNKMILDAISSLPTDRYSIVVGYTSSQGMNNKKIGDPKTVFIPRGFWGRAFGLVWRLVGLPMGGWRKICPHFHPVAKTLLREHCDLWIFPSQDGWSYQVPVPALVSILDLMHRYERQFPEVSARGEYFLRERHYRNICRWAKGILVDSEVGKQHVVESYGVAPERVHVLPYVAPESVSSCKAPENFDARYQLPEKFIFYPAQFWEHKNHKRLIQAVGRLKESIPDIKVVLVGSKKNAYPSAVRLAEDLNVSRDVIFLGYVPDEDLPEIYRRARALIMPTFFGPTNIPPLEAFAIGCPTAISGIYGIPEQVGDAALLFHPESVTEIAEGIRRLWFDDDLCAELVEKGKEKAAKWGQPQFNDRLREIIEQILE